MKRKAGGHLIIPLYFFVFMWYIDVEVDEMFENSKWITRHVHTEWRFLSLDEMPPSPYFIKDIKIEKPLKKAVLNIVGLGEAAYYVNGCRIPDSYLPTYRSCYYKTVFYNIYDITDMLTVGENRIGAVLGNTGHTDPGTVRYRSVNNKLIAELSLEYFDGSAEKVVSGTDWLTHDSPTLMSRRRCGDVYDARLEVKDWNRPGTPTDGFEHAMICRGAGGTFLPLNIPPKKVHAVIKGTEIAPGIFDFGINTSGWVRIRVSGKRGSRLEIKYSELLNDTKTELFRDNITNGGNHTDVYILKGEGVEEWEQLFEYHGFKYVGVEGDYDTVEVEALTVHTDLAPTASFICNDSTLNSIYEAANNSILTCCQGIMVDCPHREQNEWTGDAGLAAETLCMCYDTYELFDAWMQCFKDDQKGDGQLSCIIPGGWSEWSSNFANGIDWDSAIIRIPYYVMKYTGRREIVDKLWDNMLKSMDFFGYMEDGGLLDHGVGDWAGSGRQCPKEITDTAFYRLDALMLAEMAEFTGRDPKPFIEKAEQIKCSFRAKYVKDGRLDETHETALAMAIYAGFLEEDECVSEAARLNETIKENGYELHGGTHFLISGLDVLTKYGYTETVYKALVNDKVPGYAFTLKSGEKTLWEHPHGKTSHNHYFKCQPYSWFIKTLAGIGFNGFGFGDIVIEPHFIDEITTVSASVRGVSVEYDQSLFKVTSKFPFKLKLNGAEESFAAGSYCFER